MTTRPQTSPHIKDGYAPLGDLVVRALRLFGESAPNTADAEYSNMMLDLGNMVIDIVRTHPYWSMQSPAVDLPYYKHIQEARPVPDMVMLAGLRFLYADQQGSAKTPSLSAQFYQTMNSQLWDLISGPGSAPLTMTIPDGGTNPAYHKDFDPITGRVTK